MQIYQKYKVQISVPREVNLMPVLASVADFLDKSAANQHLVVLFREFAEA